jgi:hypothetical protein
VEESELLDLDALADASIEDLQRVCRLHGTQATGQREDMLARLRIVADFAKSVRDSSERVIPSCSDRKCTQEKEDARLRAWAREHADSL